MMNGFASDTRRTRPGSIEEKFYSRAGQKLLCPQGLPRTSLSTATYYEGPNYPQKLEYLTTIAT